MDPCTLQISAGTVRYLESGKGWPVVLLHAFPLSAEMWRPQLEHVPDGWRMLAPDLRGFGGSRTSVARTFDDMAVDIVEWLDRLEIDAATIGGLSMGGYVTFALFRRAPERFNAMILANTRAIADSPDGRAARDKMSELVRREGASAVADQMLPKLVGATSQARPELAVTVRAMIEAQSVEAIDGAIRALRDRPDSTPLLPHIGVPALVIAGEEDAIIPVSESADMARQLARAQQVTIPHAGHLSNLEAPDAFNAALENFLRAHL
jgi:3-oxoadipate enol-lactonase